MPDKIEKKPREPMKPLSRTDILVNGITMSLLRLVDEEIHKKDRVTICYGNRDKDKDKEKFLDGVVKSLPSNVIKPSGGFLSRVAAEIKEIQP